MALEGSSPCWQNPFEANIFPLRYILILSSRLPFRFLTFLSLLIVTYKISHLPPARYTSSITFRTSNRIIISWHVAPSCWNHVAKFCTLRRFSGVPHGHICSPKFRTRIVIRRRLGDTSNMWQRSDVWIVVPLTEHCTTNRELPYSIRLCVRLDRRAH